MAGQRDASQQRGQRACATELLRQAAQQAGAAVWTTPQHRWHHQRAGGCHRATAGAQLQVPEPSDEPAAATSKPIHPQVCRANARAFATSCCRYPGVDVKLLRQRAEALLLELRCANDGGTAFRAAAGQWSNCPSGAEGGDLGWLSHRLRPEFAQRGLWRR